MKKNIKDIAQISMNQTIKKRGKKKTPIRFFV
jgi:hypothetical protein